MGHPPNNDECNSQIACRGLRVIEYSRHISCHLGGRVDPFELPSFNDFRPSRVMDFGGGALWAVLCVDEICQEELGVRVDFQL